MTKRVCTLDELPALAQELLRSTDNRILAFFGEMGAGKTTFIKTLCRELGVVDEVQSPTFSLVNEYHTRDGQGVYHFDFYRIEDESELYDMGVEDYLYSGRYCFIEWPELGSSVLPSETLSVRIDREDDCRLISW
jgi:tRNA threonylcarbamoyladenosine biosynthesis protein TsaE